MIETGVDQIIEYRLTQGINILNINKIADILGKRFIADSYFLKILIILMPNKLSREMGLIESSFLRLIF